MVVEVEYWKSLVSSLGKPKIPILPYEPEHRQLPPRILDVFSAWKGIESVLGDLITRFDIGTGRCLEFGVERGYSTAALSCFFDSVTGVDTFVGDKHTGEWSDLYDSTLSRLSNFDNIRIVRSNYQNWIGHKRAVIDIARKSGKTFYNFKEFYGLGILI